MLVSLDQSSLISWECSSYLIAWVAESFSTEMRRLARGRRLIPQRRSYLASTSKICRSPPNYWKLSNARPSTYLTNLAFQKSQFSFENEFIIGISVPCSSQLSDDLRIERWKRSTYPTGGRAFINRARSQARSSSTWSFTLFCSSPARKTVCLIWVGSCRRRRSRYWYWTPAAP